MAQQDKSKPVKSFSAGNIQVSIWRQEVDKGGQIRVRHSVKIQKQYKNDKDEWTNTDYYFPEELAKLESLVRKAFDFITVKESTDSEEAIPI